MRAGRKKRRTGRPKRSEYTSTRRTSQRLADRRGNSKTSEADSLFDDSSDFGFDQLPLDNANRAEIPASISLYSSSDDGISHIQSNRVDRTAGDCAGSPIYFDGQENPDFDGSHALSLEDGHNWVGTNALEVNFYEPTVQLSRPTVDEREEPYGSTKFTNWYVDCAQRQPSEVSRSPQQVEIRRPQLKEFNDAQLCKILSEMSSRLQERLRPSHPSDPILDRQGQLVVLMNQLLNTIERSNIHIMGPQVESVRREEKRKPGILEMDEEKRVMLEHIQDAMRAKSWLRVHLQD